MKGFWNSPAVNWALRIVIVAAMILAALGAGNPATADPLPDWINTGSNLLCLLIAGAVLLPMTQSLGAAAAAVVMAASMATNYWVDGPSYFWQVLPFNLVTSLAAIMLLRRIKRMPRPKREE